MNQQVKVAYITKEVTSLTPCYHADTNSIIKYQAWRIKIMSIVHNSCTQLVVVSWGSALHTPGNSKHTNLFYKNRITVSTLAIVDRAWSTVTQLMAISHINNWNHIYIATAFLLYQYALNFTRKPNSILEPL